jgi:hypothetical protein
MALEFTTAKRRMDPVSFSLDGREFAFTPPKLAGAILDALSSDDQGTLLDWFAQGLSSDDEAFITARLRDPDDDLDVDDIGRIVQALVERVVGRPTKSRPGLRRPR